MAAEPVWFSACSPRARRIPKAVRDWLAESGSLTARLEALAGPIQVRLLYQGWGRLFVGEATALRSPWERRAWIREVALSAAGEPLVLARTVAPAATLTGPGKRFARLGTRPLGEVLFSRPAAIRVDRVWTLPHPACWLEVYGAPPRWGRRTLYRTYPNLPLLVSEFFLPAVFALEGGDGLA
ncbi:chorismate lyase [Methylothermus subterraneus]